MRTGSVVRGIVVAGMAAAGLAIAVVPAAAAGSPDIAPCFAGQGSGGDIENSGGDVEVVPAAECD